METLRRSDEDRDEDEASSSSSPLPLSRRVGAEDRKLHVRVQWARQHHAQVTHDVEFIEMDTDRRRLNRRAHAVRTRSGWKWKQDKKSFAIYSRLRSTPESAANAVGSPLSASTSLPSADQGHASWSREWLAVGEVACAVSDLAKLLSPSSESDFNSAMKALYRSSFIYGSVVHSAKARRQDGASEDGGCALPPLLVKTCSFVRSHLFSRKNDQLCFVEQLAPTQRGGFTVAVCSLPAHELTAGTASGELVREVHPFSAFWSVEPSSEPSRGGCTTVRVLYHVCLYSSEPVSSDRRQESAINHSRHAITRMSLLIKGATARLEKLLVAGKRRARLGTDPPSSLSIGGGSAASSGAAALPGGHHNTYCIACTRHLFGLFQSTAWRRCELCAYHVCEACCSTQRLPTREVLHVCLRCTDSREFREYSSALRDTPRRHTVPAPASDMDSSRGSEATGGTNGLILEDPEESSRGGVEVAYRSRVSNDQPSEFSL